MKKIDPRILKKFLLSAHQNLKEIETEPLNSGITTQVHFKELDQQNLEYKEISITKEHLSGMQIVSERSVKGPEDGSYIQPIWVMAYYGVILNKKVPVKEIQAFLARALQQTESSIPILPVRGPFKFMDGDWEYTNECNSDDIYRFEGIETIRYRNVPVFICKYQGGGFTI